ncbi:MAG: ribonuclease III [Armatimonadetes bacterium]|nr:ribonuclease III [Armatimonadota bacterium]
MKRTNLTPERKKKLRELMQRLKINLKDLTLLEEALTHPSYCAEHPNLALPSNQRLEFLGDSVLNLIVAQHLYARYTDLPEGELTRIRAAAVSERVLSQVASKIGLGDFLLLGKGEERAGGRERPSILADALEAVIGAIFVERGLRATAKAILPLLSEHIELIHSKHIVLDYKGRLQELTQRHFRSMPTYSVVSEHGPNHMKTFVVTVCVGRKRIATGTGKSKKEAEQAAARLALEKLTKRLGK